MSVKSVLFGRPRQFGYAPRHTLVEVDGVVAPGELILKERSAREQRRDQHPIGHRLKHMPILVVAAAVAVIIILFY